MNLSILSTPLPAKDAVKAAALLNGRLPTPQELLDMDFTKSNIEQLQTTLKHVSFWTNDIVNKQHRWAVDKGNQLKVQQHHSCPLSVLVVLDS